MQNDTAEIIRRYEAGESMPTLAAAFDVPLHVIHRVLVTNGIKRRRRGAPKGVTERTNNLYEMFVRYKKEGMSYRDMGNMVGLSRQRVQQIMRRCESDQKLAN